MFPVFYRLVSAHTGKKAAIGKTYRLLFCLTGSKQQQQQNLYVCVRACVRACVRVCVCVCVLRTAV